MAKEIKTPKPKQQNTLDLEKLTNFAKRKGFVFASSEIYGRFQAVYDYAHYGILLKNNIQNAWWRTYRQLCRASNRL